VHVIFDHKCFFCFFPVSVLILPNSGCSILSSLGSTVYNTLDFACFFRSFQLGTKLPGSPIAAAATSQVKLCPYGEEEPHIWFRLIEAQFAAAGIRSQRLKYANILASLPKQVLRDIQDTIDVCKDSDQPFDHLKEVLLRQFGKSKRQSYFDLLRLWELGK
jgi:hypothetical protein